MSGWMNVFVEAKPAPIDELHLKSAQIDPFHGDVAKTGAVERNAALDGP